ncbi:MAG: flagellar type III secretion system protein FlhB [Pseudomonadota bacterium]
MADDQDRDSKTEDPTEKKISDALEKGNVPFSREVTYVVTTLAITLVAIFYGSTFVAQLTNVLQSVFARSTDWSLATGEDAMDVALFLVSAVSLCMLPIVAPLMLFGLVSSLAQNMPRLVLDRIQPKLERVSLAKGMTRLLGWHGLKEFAKSFFKFSSAGFISFFIAVYHVDWVLSHLLIDSMQIPVTVHKLFVQVCISLVLLITILGVVDLIWTRREWFDKLKMSHQDIKDERKQSEGDPMVKMRSQSMARDRARNKMISHVPDATLVIANPTHFSIALRYRPEVDHAPLVLAKGQDLIALKIREMAEESDIPIIEDKPLARSMYKVCTVDQEIPIEFYVPIARIVRILSEKEQKKFS